VQPIEEPSLLLSGISKIYGSGAAEVKALDSVSLAIAEGEFVAMMGASGSGKSTCMNILGCLDSPTRGQYLFHGVDVAKLDDDQLSRIRRDHIGFVFQGFNLLARTTALENVELPLIYQRVTRRERHDRAMEALSAVGLSGRERHTPAELSGGQQQRVAVARALVGEPSLLLADEPTGNLDSARSIELVELLVDLNQRRGLTVVMVTHEPDLASYAQRVLEFRDGRIVGDSSAVSDSRTDPGGLAKGSA
jgi:putative ABC transport system ATP-binding protein